LGFVDVDLLASMRRREVAKAGVDLDWFIRRDLLRWRASGVDTLLEDNSVFGQDVCRTRIKTEEELRAAFENFIAEGWEDWVDESYEIRAWLDVSPFRVWTIYDRAQASLHEHLNDIMHDLLTGIDSCEPDRFIQKQWDRLVKEWAGNLTGKPA